MTKEKQKIETIAQALHHIQLNLHAPKNQFNKFGNYKYRSCEDILEGLKKIMPDNCYVTIQDEIVLVGDRVYVKAIASLCYGENCISNTAFAREPESRKGMDESQITGATSSYARKYALNGLFLIDDVKDADGQDKPENDTAQNRGKSRQIAQTKPEAKNTDSMRERKKAAYNEIISALNASGDFDGLRKTLDDYIAGKDVNGIKLSDLHKDRQKEIENVYAERLVHFSQAPMEE